MYPGCSPFRNGPLETLVYVEEIECYSDEERQACNKFIEKYLMVIRQRPRYATDHVR
jgi:hypothetical protein